MRQMSIRETPTDVILNIMAEKRESVMAKDALLINVTALLQR